MTTDKCAQCEVLREEIADYMGHRTDSIAGKLWSANFMFNRFEEQLDHLVGEFERLGHDHYDQSLEIRETANDARLSEDAQRLIRDAGFCKAYVNHLDGWETHYSFGDRTLPVRGWRRRYVREPTSAYDRVIAGDPDPGYWEISYWPEGWNSPGMIAEREAGHYRIVPDQLEKDQPHD